LVYKGIATQHRGVGLLRLRGGAGIQRRVLINGHFIPPWGWPPHFVERKTLS